MVKTTDQITIKEKERKLTIITNHHKQNNNYKQSQDKAKTAN